MKAILKINDKEIEVEVSEEQLWKLKKKSPFERKIINEEYYCIMSDGEIHDIVEKFSMTDNGRFFSANYCADRDLLQQQAYRETLNRLLWRWQFENDEPVDWRKRTDKFSIYYSYETECFNFDSAVRCKDQGAVYFSDSDKAKQAIEEVIKPFMAEHPDFVW